MGRQILDATMLPAPKKQGHRCGESHNQGGRVPADWKPAKAAPKDRDARWTVKYSKAKVKEGAAPGASKSVDLAIPMFGYKNHVGVD
jgi:hypothetical protein